MVMDSEFMNDFVKYPKIFRLGHEKNREIFEDGEDEIIIEEKVDGANFRFGNIDGKLHYGSRRVDFVEKGSVAEQFVKAVDEVKRLEDKLRPGYVYFVEYMIPHTIQYDWDRVPVFLGFDIYDVEKKKFIDYDKKIEEFARLGIEVVPLVAKVKASNIDEKFLESVIPESRYYNGLAEGVIFKNYGKQLFAKLIAEKFKEMNKEVFGGSKKQAKTDEEYLLEKYVPPRRVEKVIQSLLNEGYVLSMELMKILPMRVLDDVIEEEGFEIFRENKVVDLRKFRKMISKRCVNVLQRMIAVNAIVSRR